MKYIALGLLAVLVSVVLAGCGVKAYVPKDDAEKTLMAFFQKNPDRVVTDMKSDGQPIDSPAFGPMAATKLQAYKVTSVSKKDKKKPPMTSTIFYDLNKKDVGTPPPPSMMRDRMPPTK